MTPLTITTTIGIIGASVILFAFFMNQTHRWKDTDFRYDLVNTIGGVFLIVYAYLLESIPFLILNIVWAGISMKDVVSKMSRS